MEHSVDQSAKHFESSKKTNKPDGWITPGGIFYGCTPEEHDDSAKYLLQTNKAHIKKLLDKNQEYGTLGQIEELNPRIILRKAGYALLSNGLLVEQNLPYSFTTKQMEFMVQNHLAFAPESGKLEPAIYLELKDWLKTNLEIENLLEKVRYGHDENEQQLKSFIENPSSLALLSDSFKGDEIFESIAKDNTDEITRLSIRGRDRERMRWRKIHLPSGSEVFLEFNHHEHHADNNIREEDSFEFVSRQAVETFLKKIDSRGWGRS